MTQSTISDDRLDRIEQKLDHLSITVPAILGRVNINNTFCPIMCVEKIEGKTLSDTVKATIKDAAKKLSESSKREFMPTLSP